VGVIVSRNRRISVVGAGYVGLVTAAGFASRGFQVVVSTHDKKKAGLINRGEPPFYEPYMDLLLKKVVAEGRLKCVIERSEAISNSKITFLCTATPSRTDGSIDMQHVESAAEDIGKVLAHSSEHHLVVVKSTVVPGTTQKLVKPVIEKYSRKKCGEEFSLCMNPEFLREGNAIYDTFHPDRVVIGEYDENSGSLLERLYNRFFRDSDVPILRTSLSTAEVTKYASNAFLATKISFINSIASICERIPGSDIATVARAMGLDKRISPAFLNAGLGYGGSCLPKDVKALIAFCKNLGCSSDLLEAVDNVNKKQSHKAVELPERFIPSLKNKRIALLGLAFKPNTDDIREAVSLRVIQELLAQEANVVVYDPVAAKHVGQVFGSRIEYARSALNCIKHSDCCIVTTEWEEFKSIKPSTFVKHMKTPIVIDGRRIYNPSKFAKTLNYAAIGLSSIEHAPT
jgi:UDPglucose 6-dehydrogenase